MTTLEDHFHLRSGWLALAFLSSALPALLLQPYFGWSHPAVYAMTGGLGVLFGAYRKYRSRFGTTQWLATIAFTVFVMLPVLATGFTAVVLSAVIGRADLVPMGGVVSGLCIACPLLLGSVSARRDVHASMREPCPAWMASRVELSSGRFKDAEPQSVAVSAPMRYMMLLLAVGLNLPLMFAILGRGNYLFLVPLMPVVLWLLGRVAFAAGQNLAYVLALKALERESGRRFQTSRMDEIRALRRTFWFARWLCRPDDLVLKPSIR